MVKVCSALSADTPADCMSDPSLIIIIIIIVSIIIILIITIVIIVIVILAVNHDELHEE